MTLVFLCTGCIMDDGAIENTCDERAAGCGDYQEQDTGETAEE